MQTVEPVFLQVLYFANFSTMSPQKYREGKKQNLRVKNNLTDLSVKIKGNEKYGLYSIWLHTRIDKFKPKPGNPPSFIL